jgi:hypothetical protein
MGLEENSLATLTRVIASWQSEDARPRQIEMKVS